MYKQLQDLRCRITNSKSLEKLKEAIDTLEEIRKNVTFTDKQLQQNVFSQIEEIYNCALIHYYIASDKERLNAIFNKCEKLCKH